MSVSDTRAERAPDPDLAGALQEAERALREAREGSLEILALTFAALGCTDDSLADFIPEAVWTSLHDRKLVSSGRDITDEGYTLTTREGHDFLEQSIEAIVAALAAAAAPSGPDEPDISGDEFDAENGIGALAEIRSLAAVNSGRCPCGGAFEEETRSCPDCGRPEGCSFPDCHCDPQEGCAAPSGEPPSEQEQRRDDAASYGSYLAADEAASTAHDFIWARNGVTQKQASNAIWVIHDALRPLIILDGDDVAGSLEGDVDLKDRLRNIDDVALRNYLSFGERDAGPQPPETT